jgi:hypothetical protein
VAIPAANGLPVGPPDHLLHMRVRAMGSHIPRGMAVPAPVDLVCVLKFDTLQYMRHCGNLIYANLLQHSHHANVTSITLLQERGEMQWMYINILFEMSELQVRVSNFSRSRPCRYS